MPREYQSKISGGYLPHNVYMQVKYIIVDYERMRAEHEKIMHSRPYNDGQPRGTQPGDPTASKGLKLAMLSGRIEAIDEVVHDLNAHYLNNIKRDDIDYFDSLSAFADYGYFCYALYDPYNEKQPSQITWKRFRSKMIREVAVKLYLF